MDFETIDVLFRSRQTLLKILAAKGYNTIPYEKFGPFEIELMASGTRGTSLNMDLEREVPEGADLPRKCHVEYGIPHVKTRLNSFMAKLLENEAFDPAETEIIVITLDPIGDTFTVAVTKVWIATKQRIAFFDANTLVSNPLEHVLVPKHEVVPKDQHTDLLKRLKCDSKAKFPIIRFHDDIIGRLLGLVPGDIVKITRPSPQAGQYIVYRVCAP